MIDEIKIYIRKLAILVYGRYLCESKFKHIAGMKTRVISVLLTVLMISCATFIANADQVKLKERKANKGGVRSIILSPTHFFVNLDNNVIHVDLLFLFGDIDVSIINSDGRLVYHQVVSSQTSSLDIDLNGEDRGVYTIYFTGETDECVLGEFTIL